MSAVILSACRLAIRDFAARRSHHSIPSFKPFLLRATVMAQVVLSAVSAVTALVAYGSLPVAGATASATVVGHDWRFETRPPTRSPGLSLAAATSGSGADTRGIWAGYESANCTDVPVMVIAENECTFQSSYEDDGCLFLGDSGSSSEESEDTVLGAIAYCAADLPSTLDELYDDQAYLRVDYYVDSNCSELLNTNVFVADGVCHAMNYVDGNTGEYGILSKITTIWDNGTASISWYNGSDCTGATTYTLTYTKEQLSASACQASTVGYASSGDGDGGLSTEAIVGIVVGCVAFLALVAGFVLWRRQRGRRNGDTGAATAMQPVGAGTSVQAPETPDQRANPYQSAA